ncbi:MAG: sialidase family protein [Ignavibacteriaceae bacterium]|nr:sialidase family protein [Ignavibacteriaceae bacterium]
MRNLTTLFFALFFAVNIFAQSDNSQQIPSMRDGLREEYTQSDFETFYIREKNGEIQNEVSIIYATAAADALVNNNTGSTGTSNFTQSETAIVAFGNNVVIGFNDSGSYTGGANKFTGFSYSTDGGASFVDGGTLPTNTIGDAGDPVLARNETTGRIYLSTLGFSGSGTIQMFRSDDNGLTWMAPTNATPGGSSEDKQWHTVDNFAGAGNGNVYMISRRFGGSPGIYLLSFNGSWKYFQSFREV